ncbi:MAG: universal stress protein [Nocardioidaceae bacterium]
MTLLVGFAPGRADRSGLELAAALARSIDTDLLVVTVVPASWPTPVAGHTDREFEAWATERGEEGVAEAKELLAEHYPDIAAEATWVSGRSVPTALLEECEKREASMLVLGSGHDGNYGHVNLSTTADRLLHSAHLPVALATRGYRTDGQGTLSRATCAFRGDEVSRSTLHRTAEICHEVGAGLRIVTFAVRGRNMYPPETGTQNEDMVLDAWVSQAEKMQHEAMAELDPGLSVETAVATAPSWGDVIGRLEWRRDEVLVIGSSSSASLLSRIFLGSSASKILRHSPVPVIVVP